MRTVALWAAVCWAAWLSHNAQAAIGLLENHVNGVLCVWACGDVVSVRFQCVCRALRSQCVEHVLV